MATTATARKARNRSSTPASTEVFRGNRQDPRAFGAQVRKANQRFGCRRVNFVGDRGMIKGGQIEELSQAGFQDGLPQLSNF